MGTDDYIVEQVGCVCPDFGPYLLGGGSVGHAVRFVYVVGDTPYWEVCGWITLQSGP